MRAKRKNVCEVCRSRKLACDGKQPQCSQCVLRRTPCSGYRQEFVFVSQSSSKREVKAVRRIVQTKKLRSLQQFGISAPESPRPASSARAKPFDQQLTGAGLNVDELEDDIQFIVDYFAPIQSVGPAELNPYRDQICGVWVGMIPSLPGSSRNKRYLRSAVKTLASSLQRHGFESRPCEPEMLEMYGHSIVELGMALEIAGGSFEVDLGVAILCLAVADIMIPTLKSDWMIHVNGIGNLIETLGPASFATGTLKTLFIGLRPMLLISCIANRHDTFLARDEWTTHRFRGGQGSMLQRLFNQAVKLPALLSRSDGIGTFTSPSSFAPAIQLQKDFQDFTENLWEWESNLRSAELLPSYWLRTTCAESTFATKNIIWYPNIMTANSLTYCWAFEIIARTQLAILEVHTSKRQGHDLDFRDSRTDGHTSIKPREQRSIAALAEMICNSMPFFLQPEFKLYGPGSTFFTLPTAMRVFQDEPARYSSQLALCQVILDHLASIGVFFPRT